MSIAITIKLLLSSGEMHALADSESDEDFEMVQEVIQENYSFFRSSMEKDDDKKSGVKRPAQACPSMFLRMRKG